MFMYAYRYVFECIYIAPRGGAHTYATSDATTVTRCNAQQQSLQQNSCGAKCATPRALRPDDILCEFPAVCRQLNTQFTTRNNSSAPFAKFVFVYYTKWLQSWLLRNLRGTGREGGGQRKEGGRARGKARGGGGGRGGGEAGRQS